MSKKAPGNISPENKTSWDMGYDALCQKFLVSLESPDKHCTRFCNASKLLIGAEILCVPAARNPKG